MDFVSKVFFVPGFPQRQEKEGGEQALGRLPGVRNPNNFDPPFFFTCEKPVAMAAMGLIHPEKCGEKTKKS